MIILVTGVNGFLGSAIARQAVSEGITVRGIDRYPFSQVKNMEYFQADIVNMNDMFPPFTDASVVIHAAGLAHVFDKAQKILSPFREVNEVGTLKVAQAAGKAGVRNFILISSVSVYGGSRDGGAEDSGCFPQGPYAESKYQAEKRAIEVAEEFGMNLSILRLATLYGEGDPGNVAKLMRSIDRRRFFWIGNGSNRKSLLHREDAARACLEVAKAPASGVQVYNVAAPPCTMREVVEGLAGALARRIPGMKVPASLARRMPGFLSGLPVGRLQALGATVQKWLADDVYDGSKFAQTFNFQTNVILTDGLRREVAWYRAEQERCGKNFKL